VLYFDCNATAPVCRVARETWLKAVEEFVGNPSSQHRLGKRAERALEEARSEMAELLGCGAESLVWTSGASEAANTVISHLAASREGEAWVSAIEHPCVLESAHRWFPGRVRLMPVWGSGEADLEWVRRKLGQGRRPAFVAVMAANNETGILQPWREALELCRSVQVPMVCDAAQWIGKLPAGGLGECDYVIGCGHKFGAPSGVGFFKCGRGKFKPLIVGGPQEEGRRAGTENVAGVLSMMATLRGRESEMSDRKRFTKSEVFLGRVRKSIPGVRLVGADCTARLWNTVTTVLPVPDCRARWVVKLDKAGVAASTGSACASGKEKVSHVLEAMGLSAEEGSGVVRFSSAWETTAQEWEKLAGIVETVWGEMNAP
jgi:cysteine desulfurase